MKLVNLYRVSQIGILVCTLNVYGQEGSNKVGNVENRVDNILSQMTPHFSRPREKCAQSADPAAAGSGLTAKAFPCPESFRGDR